MFQLKSVSSIIPAFILFSIIQSCTSGTPIDSNAVKKEMASREIKRVSSGELMEKAMDLGNILVASAQNELQMELTSKINEEGVTAAISYCKTNALPILSKSSDSLSISVMRVSNKFRNPNDEPDSLESLILEAYQYVLNNGGDLKPSVIEENKYVLLYTKPIIITNGMCLNCHGKVGADITENVLSEINKQYPNDKATGYAIGELRGMWAIRIPKKTIVNLL